MKLVKKVIDSILILDVTGEIRLGESAAQLSAELERVLNDDTVKGVILNMENINYIDSTGLGELVGYLGRFKDKGKKLRLVKPNHTVVRLLQLTKLDQVFIIKSDEESALEDLAGE
ncbi:MAG: STAS domain-containing protein [Acidobacteriota bacterium]|nr:STAS domain-containing protein [Thermoanaerobaculaceae bacterium]